jgi:hypothetical protein
MIGLTRIAKTGGPLTKRISLSPESALKSDGSARSMARGRAQRVHLDSLNEFADMLESLKSHEAVALGNLREDLPASVQVLTQDRLTKLNGAAAPGTIARTAEHIAYASGRTALALVDIDTKGMPETVRQRIIEFGGYWKALVTALPPWPQPPASFAPAPPPAFSAPTRERHSPVQAAFTSIYWCRMAPTSNVSCVRCTTDFGCTDSVGSWWVPLGNYLTDRSRTGWWAKPSDSFSKARPSSFRPLPKTSRRGGRKCTKAIG